MPGDDAERYVQDLRRFAASVLPVFRVAEWEGTWLLGNRAGVGGVAADGTRIDVLMAQEVWHRRAEIRGDAITVTSSRPRDDSDRYSRFGNMAIQILKDRGAADRSDTRMFELMDALHRGAFPPSTTTFLVDGEAIDFELFVVGSVWLACAYLEDLNIEILGHHTPFADLTLTRVSEPVSA